MEIRMRINLKHLIFGGVYFGEDVVPSFQTGFMEAMR